MPTRKPSKYGNNFRSNKVSYDPRKTKTVEFSTLRSSEATSQDEKLQATRLAHSIDESMGFARFESGKKRIGWLCNMHSTSIEDAKLSGGRAGVDFYFLGDNGDNFKATVQYDPYFLIAVKRGKEAEVEEWCKRMFEGLVKTVTRTEKEDLQMPNHLLGYRRTFLQLSFANVSDLLSVRKAIMPIAEKNKSSLKVMRRAANLAAVGFAVMSMGQYAWCESRRKEEAQGMALAIIGMKKLQEKRRLEKEAEEAKAEAERLAEEQRKRQKSSWSFW